MLTHYLQVCETSFVLLWPHTNRSEAGCNGAEEPLLTSQKAEGLKEGFSLEAKARTGAEAAMLPFTRQCCLVRRIDFTGNAWHPADHSAHDSWLLDICLQLS